MLYINVSYIFSYILIFTFLSVFIFGDLTVFSFFYLPLSFLSLLLPYFISQLFGSHPFQN